MADSQPAAYFDTSALLKRYVREAGSAEVRRLLRSRRVVSSALLHVEALAAVRRRLREGRISAPGARRVLRRIDGDAAFWWLASVSDDVLAAARALVLRSSARTLDAIHVASASLLVAEGVSMSFVTADRTQAEVARGNGLDVVEVGS